MKFSKSSVAGLYKLTPFEWATQTLCFRSRKSDFTKLWLSEEGLWGSLK